MKLRSPLRFGIRFLLLAMLLLCLGLGWFAKLHHDGRQRLLAADALRGYGVIVLEARQENDICNVSVTLINGQATPTVVEVGGVKPYEEYDDGFFRSLFGDAVFAEHTILVFHQQVDVTADELQVEIDNLPNLKTIHINQNEIDRPLIEALQSRNPAIEFRINNIGIHPLATKPTQVLLRVLTLAALETKKPSPQQICRDEGSCSAF